MWNSVLEQPSARQILAKLNKEQTAAVVELLYIVVASDDEVSEQELEEARAQLEKLSFGWSRDDREVREVVARAWQQGTSFDDREALRSYIQTLAQELPAGEVREVVFMMAAFVSAADGVVPSETELLSWLGKACGISEARCNQIIQELT